MRNVRKNRHTQKHPGLHSDGQVNQGVFAVALCGAIPLFILCYKFIHSLLERGTTESVEELAARVADLEKRKGYKQQLAALQAGKFTGFIKRGIAGGADIVKHTVNTARGAAKQQPVNSEQRTP